MGAAAAEPGRPGSAPVALAKEILDMAGVKGGLVAHFGCAGGELTAALRPSDACVVHGLAFDADSAEKARCHIRSLGLYGSVSVELFSGERLPYIDNRVNLFVAVTAGGRFFSISDEAPVASTDFPPEWQLVARDAFNGVLLWKRSIPTWENFQRGFRSGPPELSRRLVATGDRVYVTLGLDAPVAALDPATGQTLATYAGTVDAGDGQVGWKRSDAQPLPVSLTAGPDHIFWLDPDALVCADGRTGADLWRAPRLESVCDNGKVLLIASTWQWPRSAYAIPVTGSIGVRPFCCGGQNFTDQHGDCLLVSLRYVPERFPVCLVHFERIDRRIENMVHRQHSVADHLADVVPPRNEFDRAVLAVVRTGIDHAEAVVLFQNIPPPTGDGSDDGQIVRVAFVLEDCYAGLRPTDPQPAGLS
jgi:hypothetical protein